MRAKKRLRIWDERGVGSHIPSWLGHELTAPRGKSPPSWQPTQLYYNCVDCGIYSRADSVEQWPQLPLASKSLPRYLLSCTEVLPKADEGRRRHTSPCFAVAIVRLHYCYHCYLTRSSSRI